MNKFKENDFIDLDLYSRQIGTFGIDTMKKLIKLKILYYQDLRKYGSSTQKS